MSEILKDGLIAVVWLVMGLAIGFELGGAWARSVGASARTRRVDDDATEPVAGTPAAGNPGANAVEGPFGQSRDGSGGNRPDYGDDDGFHGESVSQKQEGRK